MSMKTKAIVITVVLAIVSFILSPILWSPSTDFPQPSAVQLALLMGVAAVESVAFGVGMAWLLLGWPLMGRVKRESKTLAIASFLSVFWLLASWWPHDNMHKHNGGNMSGLIAIDYFFHLTLIATTAIVAWYLWRLITRYELTERTA